MVLIHRKILIMKYYCIFTEYYLDMQILLKAYRNTHCHFCFEEVPTDLLFCPSCTIPVYCSNGCLEQAVGEQSSSKADSHSPKKNVYVDLEKSMDIFSNNARSIRVNMSNNHIPEHHHECGGVHWSAVLPPDIVLAARVMAVSIEKWKAFGRNSSPLDYLVSVYISTVFFSPITILELVVIMSNSYIIFVSVGFCPQLCSKSSDY